MRRREPGRAHPLGRPGLGLRRGRAPGRPRDLRARRARARHLLRDAADGARARRPRRADRRRRVRQGGACTRRGGALLAGLPGEQTVWMSHRDSVTAPPAGARVTARSETTAIAAFEAPERGLYGVQFHPEVAHTPHGTAMLENFLHRIAGAAPTWTPAAVIEQQVGGDPRAGRGRARPLRRSRAGSTAPWRRCSCTGRSATQLTCVFVDHGLPAPRRGRPGGRDVRLPLRRAARPRRSRRSASSPSSPGSPTRRRSASGSARSSSASSRRRRGGSATYRWLVQGTLYSDVIESGGSDGRRRVDQEPPQRRRPARRHAHAAGRAAAGALQGRGAAGRRGARAARADGLAPALPGARASRSASSAR